MGSELRQIYFIITRRCNLECVHCIRDSSPRARDALTLEAAEAVLDKLAVHGRRATLIVSGGEPALHPQFADIVAAARRRFRRVTVNSNGLFPDALAQVCVAGDATEVQISVDGDEMVHDSLRGAGTFRRTLRTVEALARSTPDVVVATTVDARNSGALAALDAVLAPLPFRRWTIRREVVYGRARWADALTTEAWNRLVTMAHRSFANRHRLAARPMFGADVFLPRAAAGPVDPLGQRCGTGRAKLYIRPDLVAYPCACMEEVTVGDLAREAAVTVLARLATLDLALRPDAPCHACPARDRCAGGCPGASLHVQGAFGHGDPRCPAVQALRPVRVRLPVLGVEGVV